MVALHARRPASALKVVLPLLEGSGPVPGGLAHASRLIFASSGVSLHVVFTEPLEKSAGPAVAVRRWRSFVAAPHAAQQKEETVERKTS
jgi:hypothetical protein